MANLADDTYFLNLIIWERSDQRENISDWDQNYQLQKVLLDQFLSILDCLYYGKASGREELLLCSFSGSVCGLHSCEQIVFTTSSTYCLFFVFVYIFVFVFALAKKIVFAEEDSFFLLWPVSLVWFWFIISMGRLNISASCLIHHSGVLYIFCYPSLILDYSSPLSLDIKRED